MPRSAGFLQSRRNLPHDPHGQRNFGRAAAIHPLAQILSLYIFLGDVMDTVRASHGVNLHDIGVHQAGGCVRLVVKALDVAFVLGQFALQDLEGDLPAQRSLLGKIHFGHRPLGQAAQQMKIVELPSGEIDFGGRVTSFGRDVGHDPSALLPSSAAKNARRRCTRSRPVPTAKSILPREVRLAKGPQPAGCVTLNPNAANAPVQV